MRPSIAFMLCAAVLLTACSPANGPKSAEVPNQESDMHADEQLLPLPRKNINEAEYGAKPHLIDPQNQIWRFSNGVCRYLDKDTLPWKVAVDDDGNEYINDLTMSFRAPNEAFGIPVPDEPLDEGSMLHRWVITMGIVDPRMLSGREATMREAIISPLSKAKPSVYEEPYSPSFRAYRWNIGGTFVVINQELKAAVDCDVDRSWPNPTCGGVVLLNEQESATFRMTLYALPKVEEIARSIHMLATSMRAECPDRR